MTKIWTVERTVVEQIDLTEDDGEIEDYKDAIEISKQLSSDFWQTINTDYEAWEQQ